MKRAIFLDRDGTLNFDTGYTHRPEDWQWLPGAINGIALFRRAGWLVLVVSNQSGIGRGYYDLGDLRRLESYVSRDLANYGVFVDGWYYCVHAPGENCDCRKPRPGLILSAAMDWSLDLRDCWMVGDRMLDVRAALAAGCHAGLVFNKVYAADAEEASAHIPPIPVWATLEMAAKDILAFSGQ